MASRFKIDPLSVAPDMINIDGRTEEAIDILTQLIEDPQSSQYRRLTGLLLRGDAWLKMKNSFNAEDDWLEVLTIDPNNYDALKKLGSCFPAHHSTYQRISSPTSSHNISFTGTNTEERINLPYEIWLIIAELLPTSFLRPWLGLSSTHRSIAIPRVFKDIHLAFPRLKASSRNTKNPRQANRRREILDRIISNSSFAMTVKRLTVDAEANPEELCEHLEKALPHMKSLVSFTSKLRYRKLSDEVVLTLATKVPSLRHLSVCGDFSGTQLLAPWNLYTLSIPSLLETDIQSSSDKTYMKLLDLNSSTLRRLILTRAIPHFIVGRPVGEALPLGSRISQLEHLTLRSFHSSWLSDIFIHGHNLISLTIHLREVTSCPSSALRTCSSITDLPNLRELIFIIFDPDFGISDDQFCLRSVMKFVATASALERLWLRVPTTAIALRHTVKEELWNLPRLKALKLDLPHCGESAIKELTQVLGLLPSLLETLLITFNLKFEHMVMDTFKEVDHIDRKTALLPSLKHLLLCDESWINLEVATARARRIVQGHSKLEVVGVGSNLFDVIRSCENRRDIELIYVDDIPMRKLDEEDEDRALSPLEWVWRVAE